jgi:Cu/Ag efflux protein CusF
MSDEKSYVELTNKQAMQLYKKLDDEKKKLSLQIDDISSLTYALMCQVHTESELKAKFIEELQENHNVIPIKAESA